MNKDNDNSSQDDIYSGFEPVVFPEDYPCEFKDVVSEGNAMIAAYEIARISREERMPTPHNGDDMIVWLQRLKDIIYETLNSL